MNEHQESLEALVRELESEFAVLMSNWMQDEDRIAEMEAKGVKPHEEFTAESRV